MLKGNREGFVGVFARQVIGPFRLIEGGGNGVEQSSKHALINLYQSCFSLNFCLKMDILKSSVPLFSFITGYYLDGEVIIWR